MQYRPEIDDTAIQTQDRDSRVAPLHQELEKVRRQLRHCERLVTVGTMTAMVVHEFNNLLTPIVNYAQLAQRNPKMTDKALARAISGGKRASEICQAILGMTQHDSEPETFSLRDMLHETRTAMARDPKQDCIDLILHVPEDITVTFRRIELQQVLLNLILNARDAVLERPGPRRIEIAAQRRDAILFLRVTDNGIGIAPENRDAIFEPFFTTKNEGDVKKGKKGNGLGLALSRDIVEGMGGTILVRSTPNVGTTFTLRLPQ